MDRVIIRQRYNNRVRRCRLLAQVVSQAELSRRTGIARTVISALEHHRRFLPIEYALLIKEALGCSLDDLYELTAPQDVVLKISDVGTA